MRGRADGSAWASTAVARLLDGPPQGATVFAAMEAAAYVSVPDVSSGTPVLALLAPGAIRLPIGVVLDTAELPGAGADVRVGGGSIRTRERTWRPVRWWNPRPSVLPAQLRARAAELAVLLEEEPPGSFGLPLETALHVAGALARGDAAPAVAVLGLGPGLTPAGDDVIAGALAALWHARRLDRRVAAEIAKYASTHTTALSAALLAAAARGEVIPEAAAVLAGRPATAELLRVGGTSGHALCAGMAGALVPTPEIARSVR